MTRVLIDENLSEYFAEGLHFMQLPLGDDIEVTSSAKVFGKGVADEDWIPQWGKQKGIFITQDLRIYTTKQQAKLLTEHSLGCFFLDVPKSYRYWDKVELMIKKWRDVVSLIKRSKRPFAYKITPRKVERMHI